MIAKPLNPFSARTLDHGIRTGDALAVGLAHNATEIERIVDLDRRLTAMKIPRELREGSVKIGKQFLRNAAALAESEMLDDYAKRIRLENAPVTTLSLTAWWRLPRKLTHSRRCLVIFMPSS